MNRISDTKSCLSFRNVSLSYDSHTVLSGINFDILPGSITLIIGPSGAGKSSLLQLITGQVFANIGVVSVGGDNLAVLSRAQLMQKRRSMSMMFQSNALFPELSVFENVGYLLREHFGLAEHFVQDLVLMKLESVGLRGAANLMPNELSGGMARRVALARAMILDPKLMLYDEPLTGQDPISCGVLLRLILDLHKTFGMTTVIVSHQLNLFLDMVDYVGVVVAGGLVGFGTKDAILASNEPYIRQFLQGSVEGSVPFNYPCDDFATDLEL